jgi:hypothetical protein
VCREASRGFAEARSTHPPSRFVALLEPLIKVGRGYQNQDDNSVPVLVLMVASVSAINRPVPPMAAAILASPLHEDEP